MTNNKSTRAVGSDAEDLACSYLKKLGYKVLERNFTIRGGEIDIIARDKDTLVFVEVKMRKNDKYGVAREAITYFKMKALLKTAQIYTQKIKWGDKPYRLDLLAIDFKEGSAQIELIKNIEF